MNLREKLKAGDEVIGGWCASASPIIAEAMAQSGLEFVAIDAEHSPVDVPQVYDMITAIRSASGATAPLVRAASTRYDEIKRYLDAGAAGVIAPLVNSPEDARRVVSACRFPPKGRRGLGFCRANRWGDAVTREEVEEANTEALVVIQIETAEALDKVDAIVGTPGVDVVMVGPWDLSASLGFVGEPDHPRVWEAMDPIWDACDRHGVVPGIHCTSPRRRDLDAARERGFQFLAWSLDTTLIAHALSAIR